MGTNRRNTVTTDTHGRSFSHIQIHWDSLVLAVLALATSHIKLKQAELEWQGICPPAPHPHLVFIWHSCNQCVTVTHSKRVLANLTVLSLSFRSPPWTATVTRWWTTFLINWPLRSPEHCCWACPAKTPSLRGLTRRNGSASRSVEHSELSMSPPGQPG